MTPRLSAISMVGTTAGVHCAENSTGIASRATTASAVPAASP